MDTAQIAQALRQSLPTVQQGLASQLAVILAAAVDGAITDAEARAQITALPGADVATQALISFGSAQTGDVQIGDVAGRDVIKLILNILPQPQRLQTQFYGDYALPTIYIERSDLLDQIRAQLLGSPQGLALTSAQKVQRPAALHGMGGIGKTVLARALCDDPAIRAAFPDGIFWVTLGQTPDLVRPLHGIIEQLGGSVSDNAPTPQSLKAQLAGLLETRACLIVADDIWHKQDVEVLRVGGPKCRMLATTRDAALVESLGAQIYPVPVMALEQARALLREWADGALNEAPDTLVHTIVRRLGALPLALKLAGAQLRRKDPQQWLRDFDVRKLRDRRPEQPHDSLELTFGLSLDLLSPEERRLYIALAIFREDEATPEIAVARLWDGLAGWKSDETAELLEDLAARALLELRPGDRRTIVLHDLLRDLMGFELGAKERRAAHQALVETYRPDSGHWLDVIDDGYCYDHLVYHFEAALLGDDLHSLFSGQEWMHLRLIQRGKLYDGYLDDVDRAIRYTQQLLETALESRESSLPLIEYVRPLLIRASINSRASSYEPAFVIRAVERHIWTIEQALNLARRITEDGLKAHLLIGLLHNNLVPVASRESVLQAAVHSATAVADEAVRAEVFQSLAPLLGSDERVIALAATRTFRGKAQQAIVLEALAPYLDGDQAVEAFEIARSFIAESLRTSVLSALAPRLQGEQLAQLLSIAYALTVERYQDQLLARLIPQLSEDLLIEALAAIASYNDQRQQARLLRLFVPSISLSLLYESLRLYASLEGMSAGQRAMALEHFASQPQPASRTDILAVLASMPRRRAEFIEALAAWLEGNEFIAAIDIARGLAEDRDWERVTILRSLAPYMQDDQLGDALAVGLLIKPETARGSVLLALAPRLRGSQIDAAFAAAWDITDDALRADILGALAPHLQADQLLVVFSWAKEQINVGLAADIVEALYPYLSEEQQHEVFAIALRFENERDRVRLIEALAPYLQGEHHANGLHLAFAFHDEDYQAFAFKALAGRLQHQQCVKILNRACQYTSENAYWIVLESIAPYLESDQIEPALSTSRRLGDNEVRANCLLALAVVSIGTMRDALLSEVFSAAYAILASHTRTEILARLAHHMSDEQLAEKIHTARTIYDDQPQIKLLTSLIEYLPDQTRAEVLAYIQRRGGQVEPIAATEGVAVTIQGGQLQEVLARASRLEDEWARARILRLLVTQLQPRDLQHIFSIAQAIKQEQARIPVLAAIAQALPDDVSLRIKTQKEIIKLVGTGSASSRHALLLLLAEAQLPLSFALSPDIVGQLAHQIIEICTEWQWL